MRFPNLVLVSLLILYIRYRSLRHIAKTGKTDPLPDIATEKSKVVVRIRDMLQCNEEEAATIYYNHLTDSEHLDNAETNIRYLNRNQIDNRTVVDNPFLMKMDLGKLNVVFIRALKS